MAVIAEYKFINIQNFKAANKIQQVDRLCRVVDNLLAFTHTIVH